MMVRNSILFLLGVFLIYSCEDKVKKYNGFTQIELEYLLASDEGKSWERVGKEEDGNQVIPDDCDMDNYLIFVQGTTGEPKPLLYAYNPSICDSIDFCIQHPDFCESDVDLCAENVDLCASLPDGMLFIGSWYAKKPFFDNDRSDTLVFEINENMESIFVTSISSEYATFQYKGRVGPSGGIITEFYTYTPPITE